VDSVLVGEEAGITHLLKLTLVANLILLGSLDVLFFGLIIHLVPELGASFDSGCVSDALFFYHLLDVLGRETEVRCRSLFGFHLLYGRNLRLRSGKDFTFLGVLGLLTWLDFLTLGGLTFLTLGRLSSRLS
jgi:hypothetical protein